MLLQSMGFGQQTALLLSGVAGQSKVGIWGALSSENTPWAGAGAPESQMAPNTPHPFSQDMGCSC